MGVRAVIFDIGGVLERVGPPTWVPAWRARLGLSVEAMDAALAGVDPDGPAETGVIGETSYRPATRRRWGYRPRRRAC